MKEARSEQERLGACVTQGSRMAVPASLNARHFFYRTEAPAFNAEDVRMVVDAARRHVEEVGIGVAEIKLLSSSSLGRAAAGASEALQRLSEAIPHRSLQTGEAGVLVCEWASPHVDESYAGSAFWSFVLDTGEHPYVMQTLHSEVHEGLPAVVTTTRVICKGDSFVFDPTTPHLAAPKYCSADQLLVMLQVELKDGSEDDRANILDLFRPTRVEEDDERDLG